MIPFYEPVITDEMKGEVDRQLDSGWIGPGERVSELEYLIADSAGVKHCVCTTSGTTALLLSLLCLDLEDDATVAFPSYGMIAGAHAARLLGYQTVIVPIKADTLCMDPDALEKVIETVHAVIFIDHNGYCGADLQTCQKICRQHGVALIEDACQCIGIPGAFKSGQLATLSMATSKLVTTGQGGAVLTDSDSYASGLRRLIDHGGGWRHDRQYQTVGGNFRLSDLSAAMGVAQMRDLAMLIARRRWLHTRLGAEPDTWCVARRFKDADAVIDRLQTRGISATRLYRPTGHHPCFQSDCEVAERAWKELVYLPSSNALTAGQADFIREQVECADYT